VRGCSDRVRKWAADQAGHITSCLRQAVVRAVDFQAGVGQVFAAGAFGKESGAVVVVFQVWQRHCGGSVHPLRGLFASVFAGLHSAGGFFKVVVAAGHAAGRVSTRRQNVDHGSLWRTPLPVSLIIYGQLGEPSLWERTV